jgi:hypothetical protein
MTFKNCFMLFSTSVYWNIVLSIEPVKGKILSMRIKWRRALLRYLRYAWGKSMGRIHRKGLLLIVLGLNNLHPSK